MQSGCLSVHGRASKVLMPAIATDQLGWKENRLSDTVGFWTSKLMLSWFAWLGFFDGPLGLVFAVMISWSWV
jgi:hypothetical protein